MSEIIHLTMTGSRAGQVLCGAVKEDGGIYWHALLCSNVQLSQSNICPQCLDIWYGTDEPEEEG